AATGEPVHRERPLPGAVLTRVAASHLRVGTFEYFAARGEHERVRKLAGYAIARHDPDLAGDPVPALALLRAVAARQAALVARWMNAGFIHGVMNTDNMAISGETIDYGPCAFMEAFDPAAVFSSIDHHGRYAWANQPPIAQWNLARLAEALLPAIDADPDRAAALAMEVLDDFPARYHQHLLAGRREKLGIGAGDDAADETLAADWLDLLHRHRVDFTLGWRRLADAAAGDEAPLRALFAEREAPSAWLARWRERCAEDGRGGPARAQAMRGANPFVIPRNHRVEEALAAASDSGDLAPFERLLDALRRPFDEAPELAPYGEPAPPAVTACYQTFCGT
ncbi:MAG: YdiU family protein, partial [Burkholderiales bacterium]|nr:YdiU family protein [Burkholderiales bacterium]